MTATHSDTAWVLYNDAQLEQFYLADFERGLRKVLDHAGTVEDALRWMTQEERDNGWMKHSQDAEQWVWKQGFLFTDRGREVVEMLKRIWEMEH